MISGHERPISSRNTWLESSHILISLLSAVLVMAVILAVVRLISLLYPLNPGANYLFELVFRRGPIQYLEIAAFSLASSMLIIRAVFVLLEKRATKIVVASLAEDPTAPLPENSILGRPSLISVIWESLTHSESETDPQTLDILIDLRESEMINAHTPVRYVIWLIPSLGFMGTVLGISLAVGEFGRAIVSEGDINIQKYLGPVCANLSIAFDTTFLALVLSAFLMLLLSFVERQERNLVNWVRKVFAFAVKTSRLLVSPQSSTYPTPAPAVAGVFSDNSLNRLSECIVNAVNSALRQLMDDAAKTVDEFKNLSALTSLAEEINLLRKTLEETGRRWEINFQSIEEIKSITLQLAAVLTQMNTLLTQTQAQVIQDVSDVRQTLRVLSERLDNICSIVEKLNNGAIQPKFVLTLGQ